ncbi:MAG: hypothetical protein P1U89_12595 [Verrucomicrobiales bacterium]|nr:hypothetical protein [Verrucomicrobiales bacterium]
MIDPLTLESSLKAFHADDPESCADICRRILATQSDHPLGGHLLAWSMLERGLDYSQLLTQLATSPETAKAKGIPAKATLGWLFWHAGRVHEAILALTKNIAREPQRQDLQTLLGICLLADEQPEPAEKILSSVVKRSPRNPVPRFHLAHALLHLEKWEQGFAAFEKSRFDIPMRQPGQYDHLPEKLWVDQNLQGKIIVIEGEQGFGDQIQFIRFAAYLKSILGASEVHFSCHPVLSDVMQAVPCLDSAADKIYHDFDYHVPVMSLPHRCQIRIDSDLYASPYLHPAREWIDKWHAQLPEKSERPRIGICWRSAPVVTRDHRVVQGVNLVKTRKSLSLVELEYLIQKLGPDCDIVSLQFDPDDTESALLTKNNVTIPKITNFTDTAALVGLCDHVITIDTATAHLAGAIGADTRILLNRGADWRWAHSRNGASIWYPQIKTIHQKVANRWEETIDRAVDGL